MGPRVFCAGLRLRLSEHSRLNAFDARRPPSPPPPAPLLEVGSLPQKHFTHFTPYIALIALGFSGSGFGFRLPQAVLKFGV